MKNQLKRFLGGLFFLACSTLLAMGGPPTESVGVDPSLIFIQGRQEGVANHRLVILDHQKGVLRQIYPGLASVDQKAPWPGRVAGYWDGVTAFRESQDPVQRRGLQRGYPGITTEGWQWYWDAPVWLDPGEFVLGVWNDRAITRLNTWGEESSWKPSGTPSVKGRSKVFVRLVSLQSGKHDDLLTLEVEPHTVQFALAVHAGRAFLFVNTGKVYLLDSESIQPKLVFDNFWKTAGVDLSSGQPFVNQQEFPRFKSRPFFQEDGSILLAFEGFLPDLWLGEEIERRLGGSLPEKRKAELMAKGLWPLKKTELYDLGARSAILVAFDPDSIKVKAEPPERFGDLCAENPESKNSYPIFKVGFSTLMVTPSGTIRPFDIKHFKIIE